MSYLIIQEWHLSFNAGSMPMHHPHPPPTTQRIDNHNFVLIGLAWQWSAAVLRHTVQQCNTKYSHCTEQMQVVMIVTVSYSI